MIVDEVMISLNLFVYVFTPNNKKNQSETPEERNREKQYRWESKMWKYSNLIWNDRTWSNDSNEKAIVDRSTDDSSVSMRAPKHCIIEICFVVMIVRLAGEWYQAFIKINGFVVLPIPNLWASKSEREKKYILRNVHY